MTWHQVNLLKHFVQVHKTVGRLYIMLVLKPENAAVQVSISFKC